MSPFNNRLELLRTSESIKGTCVKKSKYKQPKRNAYKIQNNKYGILYIDVNKLMNEMKLDAYRSGKIVYQVDADKSLSIYWQRDTILKPSIASTQQEFLTILIR